MITNDDHIFRMKSPLLALFIVSSFSCIHTVLADDDNLNEVSKSDLVHLEARTRGKREVANEEGAAKEGVKRAPMRFGKRAPMRFGKRAPMRFGKRDSDIDNDFGGIDFLRSVRAPMRFGKRSYGFTKKAPMRFGKRAPMRFGKRDLEEAENLDEEYDDVIFAKRAPMRFGKRSDYYDDLEDAALIFDYFDHPRL